MGWLGSMHYSAQISQKSRVYRMAEEQRSRII